MTFPRNPRDRLPRTDKNRRICIGVGRDEMAAAVGISVEQLRLYEFTQPDGSFSTTIASRVGLVLERLEASRVPLVSNGPAPVNGHRSRPGSGTIDR